MALVGGAWQGMAGEVSRPPSRGLQSAQSVPQSQSVKKWPGPPSSQMPSCVHSALPLSLPSSLLLAHVFSHMACPGMLSVAAY